MKYNNNIINPIEGIENVIYVKPTIKNKNIIVGDYTYYSGKDFESCVTHHYEFYNDKLIIGKFCQIGNNIEIVMNGANHQMNAVSTYPFYIFKAATNWKQEVPSLDNMPLKGDTIIGNDVWIGQNVTIMPGIKIGDGAIIGTNSTVTKDINPYTINGGNPCSLIRNRFDEELTKLLLEFKWWDKSAEEIDSIITILVDSDLNKVKTYLKNALQNNIN